MGKDIFKQTNNKLPPLIHDIIKQTRLEAMEPGEATWATPWSLEVNDDGEMSIKTSLIERQKRPGGTVSLKIVSDFDGLYIDATALSYTDIQRNLSVGRSSVAGDDGERAPVGGVFYPYIPETNGLDPKVVAAFNQEQGEIREDFDKYYAQTYNTEYTFAIDEIHRRQYDISQQIGEVAIDRPPKKRRWGL